MSETLSSANAILAAVMVMAGQGISAYQCVRDSEVYGDDDN